MKQYDVAIHVSRFPIKKKDVIAEYLRDNYKVEEKNLYVSETCVTANLNSFTSNAEPGELANKIREDINTEVKTTCGFCITIYKISPPVIYEFDMEDE